MDARRYEVADAIDVITSGPSTVDRGLSRSPFLRRESQRYTLLERCSINDRRIDAEHKSTKLIKARKISQWRDMIAKDNDKMKHFKICRNRDSFIYIYITLFLQILIISFYTLYTQILHKKILF